MTSPPREDPALAARQLCERIDYEFADSGLLDTALTHPSWRNERPDAAGDNQRLEFLGDSVIGLIVANHLYAALPEAREGTLSVFKSQLVCRSSLARAAEEVGLAAALRLGKGERRGGGRKRPSILADAFEALIGALELDGGYETARRVVITALAEPLAEAIVHGLHHDDEPATLRSGSVNWKTTVQELLQRGGGARPHYTLLDGRGPAHERIFVAQVSAQHDDAQLTAQGEGTSKREAENAAAAALHVLLTVSGDVDDGDRDGANDGDGDNGGRGDADSDGDGDGTVPRSN